MEYEALGQNFHDRGRRIGEQVQLLRLLWTEQSVTFEGEFERVTGAGMSPLGSARKMSDTERFSLAMGQASGLRLTYKRITE